MKKLMIALLAVAFIAGTSFAQTQKSAEKKEAPKTTQVKAEKKEAPKPAENKEVKTDKPAPKTHKKVKAENKEAAVKVEKPATPAPAPKK